MCPLFYFLYIKKRQMTAELGSQYFSTLSMLNVEFSVGTLHLLVSDPYVLQLANDFEYWNCLIKTPWNFNGLQTTISINLTTSH